MTGAGGRVIFEHTLFGEWARTAAIDEATGVEVVVVGPVVAQAERERVALQKLKKRLAPPTALSRSGEVV